MYCKHCGAPLNDEQDVCLRCGVAVGNGKAFCPRCGSETGEDALFCMNCGEPLKKKNDEGNPNLAGIRRRSIAVAIILSIITCGIYSIYWFVTLTNNMNKASGRTNDTSGGAAFGLSIVTLGIYGYFWAYKLGEKRDIVAKEEASSAILYIILSFFSLGIVVYALAQDAINKAIDRNCH